MWRVADRRPIRCYRHLLVALLLPFLLPSFFQPFAECLEITDFVSTNILPDGEVETRVYYMGVVAKETKVARGSRPGLKFRQLTDGHHLIQLIYDVDGEVIDCEFGHDRHQTESFLFNFKRDLSDLVSTSNISVESLDGRELPEELRWMNYSDLREICMERHEEIKSDIRRRKSEEHHQRLSSSRSRRSMLIVPGTLWCGARDNAKGYRDLGALLSTDRCCRRHDHCRMDIPGLTERFGYFNTSPFTLSHCRCDSSFRACLKRVGTSDANLVGKLFFDVVQTKCFVLKPKKKCVRTSWWGKCEKYKMVKQAVLKDNLPFN